MPGLLLGDEAPNFEADTTQGRIRFHDFLGDSWGILFSHPRDFTPVCTTELGRAAKLAPEFSKRNVKMIALSIDSVQDHLSWCKDINAYNGEQPAEKLPFPIIADKNRELALKLGMLDPDELDKDGMPLTARVVFVFGPDKKLKLSILYPATTGRNFDEILRVVDSLQLTAYKKVATPVDWKVRSRAELTARHWKQALKWQPASLGGGPTGWGSSSLVTVSWWCPPYLTRKPRSSSPKECSPRSSRQARSTCATPRSRSEGLSVCLSLCPAGMPEPSRAQLLSL